MHLMILKGGGQYFSSHYGTTNFIRTVDCQTLFIVFRLFHHTLIVKKTLTNLAACVPLYTLVWGRGMNFQKNHQNILLCKDHLKLVFFAKV